LQLVTRAVVQPSGGGEPVDIFDLPLPPELEADLLLAYYTQTLGEPLEAAIAEVAGVDGPVPVGWVFEVPESFEVPGAHAEFELVVVPMVADAEAGLASLFARLAEQRAEFEALQAEGQLDSLAIVERPQRRPGV
jgi:hypothetical protein